MRETDSIILQIAFQIAQPGYVRSQDSTRLYILTYIQTNKQTNTLHYHTNITTKPNTRSHYNLMVGSNNEAIAVILEGPTDKEVLLGEPTDLPCTFELSRNTDNVLPLWDRDGDYIFAHTHMNQLYWVANSSSLIGGATSELNSIAVNPGEDSTSSSPSTTTTTTTTINKLTNYSLHIKNASLEDDALFKCSVSFGSDRVANKSARLTVIKPPSELSVLAHSLTNDQSSPTTKTQVSFILIPFSITQFNFNVLFYFERAKHKRRRSKILPRSRGILLKDTK